MNSIEDDEVFYRIIKRSRPNCVRPNGKISSALFKADTAIEKGVSVDRKGKRTEQTVQAVMKSAFGKRLKGIVSIDMPDVKRAKVFAAPVPSIENKYHAELYQNEECMPMNSLQAMMLADACRLVYFNSDTRWVE